MSNRTLLIMRHAKSSWKQEGLSDFERPLNRRGKEATPTMARILQERSLVPDLVIASAAARAQQTLELLLTEWADDVPCQVDDRLYLAAPGQYLQCLREYADSQKCIMTIGHNPGLEYLVEKLTGEDEFMPTAAVAIVTHDSSWDDLSRGELIEVLRPREMD